MSAGSTPLIIGHRGASLVAPENTIAAFESALRSGADGIEFDVRLSRDGTPVVIHNPTLRRTGLMDGRVSEFTANELEQVDVGVWFGKKRTPGQLNYSGERIPTLSRVLSVLKNSEALFYIELKIDGNEGPGLALAVTKLIREHALVDRVVVESFDLASLDTVKACDADIHTAALFQHSWPQTIPFWRPRRLVDLALKSGASEIALHHRLVNSRTVEAALAADLKIVVWTVDDPVWLGRARALGLKALITNDPAGMLHHRSKATHN
jgi:glycerophosphoryl diester phosphodiesterase